MNKIKFLIASVSLLLIINIALIMLLIRNESHMKKHEGPRNEIIEKLQFNEAQIKMYDELIKDHRMQMKDNHHQMRILKNQLYEGLKSQSNAIGQDSILYRIGQKQIQIEQNHMKHFLAIRKICTPEQLANFDSLVSDIARLFSPRPPGQK